MADLTSTKPLTTEPINLLLSRDELLYILSLLGAESLPGIDPDPLGDLTPEQRTMAHQIALRSLRARELAQQRNGDGIAVHNALLAAVGVCAYPHKTLFAYHWAAGAEAPLRFFGHLRDQEVVTHSRPEADLHLFSRLPSANYLVTQLLVLCECNNSPATQAADVLIATHDFAEMRRLAEGGSSDAALDLLLQNRLPSISAQALVNTFSAAPRVSMIQLLKQEGATVQKQELTLVQNAHHAWLVQTDADVQAQLRIKVTQRAAVESIFTHWLVG